MSLRDDLIAAVIARADARLQPGHTELDALAARVDAAIAMLVESQRQQNDLARAELGAMLIARDHTGVSAEAIRATARSRAREFLNESSPGCEHGNVQLVVYSNARRRNLCMDCGATL